MGAKFEIRKEVALGAAPDQVWEAIATEPGLSGWFMPMAVDPDSDLVVGWEPGRRLAVQTAAAPDGSTHGFEYVIEPQGNGTSVLRFVHHGMTGEGWADDFESVTGSGWDMYLHTLSLYLTHFAGRPALYLEADGPPASADPDSRLRLLAALGLTEPVELGAAVRFDLPGVGPVSAVVDYAAPMFIGLQAPFALIRFHVRAPVGMTVAVSQHTYIATFDVARAEQGWKSWLAAAFR